MQVKLLRYKISKYKSFVSFLYNIKSLFLGFIVELSKDILYNKLRKGCEKMFELEDAKLELKELEKRLNELGESL